MFRAYTVDAQSEAVDANFPKFFLALVPDTGPCRNRDGLPVTPLLYSSYLDQT